MANGKMVVVDGESYPNLKAAAAKFGTPYHTVAARVRNLGWSVEEAVKTPAARKVMDRTDEEKREIRRAKNAEFRAKNPDKIKASKVRYNARNAEKISLANKARRAANPEKEAMRAEQRRAAYRELHPPRAKLTPEEVKERGRLAAKRWSEENPERAKELKVAWRAKNPDRVRANTKAFEARNPEDVYRVKSAKWRAENPEKYAARLICNGMGLRIADIPLPLARLKQEQLEIKRLNRQIKTQLKEETA